MKRSSSELEPSSPVSSESDDFKPDVTPPPPTSNKKTKGRKVPSTPAPKKKAKKESSRSGGGNGEWTPEKKEIFMDRIIATGYKGINLGELAEEVSFTCVEV